MSELPDSVTRWISNLKAGDAEAAERLWGRYFERLVGFAKVRLGGVPRGVADEEDVALSAFKSLCVGAAAGKFTQLRDRGNLWPLLAVLTAHKALDHRKSETREKRGGGVSAARPERQIDPADLLSREPTPEFAAEMVDECRHLLHLLEPELRSIALQKLEGEANVEIARRAGCGLRTIERRLEMIRRIWSDRHTGQ